MWEFLQPIGIPESRLTKLTPSWAQGFQGLLKDGVSRETLQEDSKRAASGAGNVSKWGFLYGRSAVSSCLMLQRFECFEKKLCVRQKIWTGRISKSVAGVSFILDWMRLVPVLSHIYLIHRDIGSCTNTTNRFTSNSAHRALSDIVSGLTGWICQ